MAARLEDDPLLLAEPANFDPLYSAVRHFGALSAEARDRTQEVIGEALKGATRASKRTINAMGGSDDELAERRQLLRLAAFLQSWLVREVERRLKIRPGHPAAPFRPKRPACACRPRAPPWQNTQTPQAAPRTVLARRP